MERHASQRDARDTAGWGECQRAAGEFSWRDVDSRAACTRVSQWQRGSAPGHDRGSSAVAQCRGTRMSVPTVKIDGTPVSVLAAGSMNNTNAFGITDQVEQRSTASFTIKDDAGTTHYQQGQQVEILAADGSTLFWGYIDVPTESRVIGPTNTPYLRTGCTCKDGIYWADKRVAAKAYTNTLAGDIVSDLVKSYLAAEGVVGYHVSRTESTQSDWQQGTYLLNPGFEGTYVSGVAPGWTTFATSATGVTWSQDASGHTGVAEKVTIANNPTT